MSTRALRAHIAILERHRLEIRTHEQRRPEFEGGDGWRPPSFTERLHRKIMELIANGLDDFEISDILGCSRTAVSRHRRGKIKRVRI